MTEYKGTGVDGLRIRSLENKRKKQQEGIEKEMSTMESRTKSVLNRIDSKFASESQIPTEDNHKFFGLVTNEEFKKKKAIAIREKKDAPKEIKNSRKVNKKKLDRTKLSFDLEDGEGEGEVDVSHESSPPEGEPPLKIQKVEKNPEVDTTFLPDQEQEYRAEIERRRLTEEYEREQERIKNETVPVTYSYWDGSGHRRTSIVPKGIKIEKFLEIVRSEFPRELRAVQIDGLLFIKEDLIIPHNLSFYDLIIEKARGKSGPLFHFDVHDDVRFLNDASKEKDESHAAKVVERRWYDRNKHTFPASRWEVYDPKKQRDEKYTISDRNADK